MLARNKRSAEKNGESCKLLDRVPVISTYIMAVKEEELVEEPEELKREADEGVVEKEAKKVEDEEVDPPEEGV